MSRRRSIIGIGEALLAEYPDGVEPAGLALDVAMAANKLGHHGIPISRLGQDSLANELLTQLTARKVDQSHLQSDPDLATGRLVSRTIAGQTRESLDHRAAFDNLQWDFDLVDVAQQADAVVFGMLAQRGGQSSSVIVRFLSEAKAALVACDLTNRADGTFDRGLAIRGLEFAQLAVVDAVAWTILKWGPRDMPSEEAARVLMRECDLDAVVWMDSNQSVELHTGEGSFTTDKAVEKRLQPMIIVAMLHALMRGDDTARVVENAERVAALVREHPDSDIPEDER